jgi:hypothetical protein
MLNDICLGGCGNERRATLSAKTITCVGALGLSGIQKAAEALEMNLRHPDAGDDEVRNLMDVISAAQDRLHQTLTQIDEQ